MKYRFLFPLFLLLSPALVTAQSNVPAYVPTAGLVGWWPFSGNATDSSGNGNRGIANGAVLTIDRFGVPNAAYAFDGDTGFIEVRDTFSLRLRLLTMSVWVRPEVYGRRQQLIYKGRKTDGYGEGYFLHATGEAGVKIGSSCQPNVGWRLSYFDPQGLPARNWTHLCTTFDGVFMRNYINGQQSDANPVSGQIDICNGANLRFGYGQDFYPGPRPFQGSLDEIGLWNRALTPAEVKALYAGSAPPAGIGEAALQPPQETFRLYPNPARGTAFLQTGRSAGKGPFTLLVTTIWGPCILRETFAGNTIHQIQLGNFTGWCTVAVTDTNGSVVFRKNLLVE